jgi:hypothetical protein
VQWDGKYTMGKKVNSFIQYWGWGNKH